MRIPLAVIAGLTISSGLFIITITNSHRTAPPQADITIAPGGRLIQYPKTGYRVTVEPCVVELNGSKGAVFIGNKCRKTLIESINRTGTAAAAVDGD